MFEGKLDEAANLASRAIAKQGAEPAFHGLRGDIRARQERYTDAVTNYDRAISRSPDYYGFYLGRGMARAELDERAEAKADLQQSVELLPTAVAFLELGKIAEAEGNADLASRYYQAAGQ